MSYRSSETSVPTQKTPPQVDLANQTILVYGPVKIGKSSFCALSDSALFLATKAGLNHLNVYQIPIKTWEELQNTQPKTLRRLI